MKPVQTRVKLALAAMMLLAALPSLAAAKRRSVRQPSNGPAFSGTINGSVVDATSGLPVAFATIEVLNTKIQATAQGTFEINDVNGFGSNIPVTASRTGYNPSTQTISGNGTHTLTFRLQSRPTVAVRMIDGTSYQLDDDSIKTGYVILFSGYVSTSDPKFCKADGTQTQVHLSDVKKFLGPAATVTNSACCTRENAQLQRINVTLKSGESGDWTFKDSCDGYTTDLLGRNHTSGDQLFLKFSEIAEVTFP
jgi:hypothetical protein